jgi:hypothetical protein
MADIPDPLMQPPVPVEQVRGLGVAGPPAEQPERNAERQPPETVQRENEEFSDQSVGRNVDVEA